MIHSLGKEGAYAENKFSIEIFNFGFCEEKSHTHLCFAWSGSDTFWSFLPMSETFPAAKQKETIGDRSREHYPTLGDRGILFFQDPREGYGNGRGHVKDFEKRRHLTRRGTFQPTKPLHYI